MINLSGYRSKHFALYELVPKAMFDTIPHALLWRKLDTRMLWTLDQLHNLYGTTYVNNWYWGGRNHFGCLRPFDCTIGADFSDHKYGTAVDPKFKTVTAEQVRQEVLANPFRKEFQFITIIEMNVGWFHFGVGNHNKQELGVLKIYP